MRSPKDCTHCFDLYWCPGCSGPFHGGTYHVGCLTGWNPISRLAWYTKLVAALLACLLACLLASY